MTTTWNYRLIRRKHGENEWVELREVFYKDGVPHAISSNVEWMGETREELIASMELGLKDAREREFFDPPKGWLKEP
jgi:hypothetical protein